MAFLQFRAFFKLFFFPNTCIFFFSPSKIFQLQEKKRNIPLTVNNGETCTDGKIQGSLRGKTDVILEFQIQNFLLDKVEVVNSTKLYNCSTKKYFGTFDFEGKDERDRRFRHLDYGQLPYGEDKGEREREPRTRVGIYMIG